MNNATWWWLENTAQGRRTQRRILPSSALLPRARAEAREEDKKNWPCPHCGFEVHDYDGDGIGPCRRCREIVRRDGQPHKPGRGR